jgi:chromate reductase, NAD(P)H dehydrogenase (quinone)
MSSYQIAVIVGSLRKDSFNRKFANALVKLAPPEVCLQPLAHRQPAALQSG